MGKQASDLQQNIVIDAAKSTITGILKYVTGYTQFSSVAEDQKGNFIALSVTRDPGTDGTVEVVGGKSGPVALDADNQAILKIANTNQKIKFVLVEGGVQKTITYTLTGLTLNTK